MSADKIKIGFIPLVDAAIPVITADLGFAAQEGLEIELVREVSWSNIRDRLIFGHFEAAHMLAPVAVASSLGLGAIKAPLAAPIALGLNGNAITLSPRLHDELFERLEPSANPADPYATGRAFAHLVRDRRARGDEPPVLGMTFPFSTHNYQLRLWLDQAGLDPDVDLRLAVSPPPFMVDALASGHVEGFCVGAPWNSLAVELGLGRILHLGVDLVRRCPEKVLAMRTGLLLERPELGAALIRACEKAAQWLSEPENREETAERLASSDRLDVPAEIIRRTLDGRLPIGDGRGERQADDYIMFDETRPDPRHARWLFEQMKRWGQANGSAAEAAETVYRPDLYDAALGRTPPSLTDDPLGLFTSARG
ncbi:CmpA/NrtA family ABC transporter substrate-binding protein [Hansschlegelia quercus]|uniref:Nitrate transporter n=1 Tax=Hansschlegelia quercus TaxID=2528245 RepID=A0A4Q9GJ98_9HYPH|nr:CmpA/NrtA family ABC transporter substrate-binding protein [Hansschlegelia quercus]TBN52528.1 nitrate transporter [Hansschlegelia quercus]